MYQYIKFYIVADFGLILFLNYLNLMRIDNISAILLTTCLLLQYFLLRFRKLKKIADSRKIKLETCGKEKQKIERKIFKKH